MLTRQEALQLIQEPKKIINHKEFVYDPTKVKQDYEFISTVNINHKFVLNTYNNSKVGIKLCYHFRNIEVGLLRIEYGGSSHMNPEEVSEKTPDFLLAYKGVLIPPRVPHIHIFVEGSELDWAMPIEDYCKDVKELPLSILSVSSLTEHIYAVQNVSKIVNMQNRITILDDVILP